MSKLVPKLLVSVRDASEALDALAGGADWIDMKEPLGGPLGPVSCSIAREIDIEVAGRRPLSAALGELVDWQVSESLKQLISARIGVVKLGLADCDRRDWQQQWLSTFAEIQCHGVKLAAVIYADWQEAKAPTPEAIIECAQRAGGEYLLIDTWNKSGLSTLRILGVKNLCKILLSARVCGLKTVVAGKISPEDLTVLSPLPVDVVAVRGAVCSAGRESCLEARLVKQFRNLLCSANSNCNVAIAT